MTSTRHSLSLVVPMHNEAPALDAFFARVSPILAALTSDYEIVCVDDGSTDGTLERLREFIRNDARLNDHQLKAGGLKLGGLTAD